MKARLMKMPRLFVLIMIILFFETSGVLAQELNTYSGNSFKDNWAVQLQPGFSQFYGDASNHNYFQKLRGEIGIYAGMSVRKMIIPAVGVGIDFAYAGLKSYKNQKTDGTKVDFRLSGNYSDANLFVYINFNHLFAGYKSGRRFTFYGILGAGWAFWNSALTDRITGLTIKSGSKSGNYTYKNNAFVVPVGAGLNYRINNHWGINLGGILRTVFSNDVDVWHDGFKYDQIFSTNVGITYHIRQSWGKSSRSSKRYRQRRQPRQKSYYRKKERRTKPAIPIYNYDQVNVASVPVKPARQPQITEPESAPVKKTKPVAQGIEFRVQIMAITKPLHNASGLQTRYHLPYPVVETYQDGLYRYSAGSFRDYSAAVAAGKEIRSLGISDAFVVAYRNGLRISLTPKMKKEHGPSSVNNY